MAFDAAGNIYVGDMARSSVELLTSNGSYLSSFGGYHLTPLECPSKLALDSDGAVYVSDNCTPMITVWKDGVLLRSFGTRGSGPGQLLYTYGIAVSGDRVFVSDSYNNRIEVFTRAGDCVTEWPTGDFCLGIALDDSDHVYVTGYSGRLDVFTTAGMHVRSIGTPGSGLGQLNKPYDVALDKRGFVYVADSYNERVQVFTTGGAYHSSWGGHGSAPGQFIQPRGIEVDDAGRIYVVDTWNDRIQVFGSLATPARATTWGHIKTLYR